AVAMDVEETFRRLQSHKSVIGVLVVSQDGVPIRSSFPDRDQTQRYCSMAQQLAQGARATLAACDSPLIGDSGAGSIGSELVFLRLRTKRGELLVAPDRDFLLAVLQEPASSGDIGSGLAA
ncbi:hypothetical protein BOX15_Mlig016622g2, partial [Macrostomum lignano]